MGTRKLPVEEAIDTSDSSFMMKLAALNATEAFADLWMALLKHVFFSVLLAHTETEDTGRRPYASNRHDAK